MVLRVRFLGTGFGVVAVACNRGGAAARGSAATGSARTSRRYATPVASNRGHPRPPSALGLAGLAGYAGWRRVREDGLARRRGCPGVGRLMNRVNESVFDLSPAEKLQLVEDLWDDLAANPEHVPVHDWQVRELERRKANLQNNPASGLSWEEVKRGIRSRHGR